MTKSGNNKSPFISKLSGMKLDKIKQTEVKLTKDENIVNVNIQI